MSIATIVVDGFGYGIEGDLSRREAKAGAAFRGFRHSLTSAQAATIILGSVEDGNWRCLVGDDAEAIDKGVRLAPEAIYDMESDAIAKVGNPEWRLGQKTQLERRRRGEGLQRASRL